MTLLRKYKNNLNFNIINLLLILYLLNNLIFFAYCNVLPLSVTTKPPKLLSNSDDQSSGSQFASVPNTSEPLLVSTNNTIRNGTLIFSLKTNTSTNDSTQTIAQPNIENQSTDNNGVWCYCNFPQCVRTGYMCHSESDNPGCFSKSVGNIKDSDQVHIYRQWSIDTLARGCVELLPRAERETCLNKISNLEGREDSNSNKDQHFDYNNYLPKGGDKLRCCQQNMCNYEIAKPIIIRELDESEVSLSPERGWLQGLTIGVSVLGIVVLIFLIAFAGKILTASDEKSRSSELLNELSSRDFYIKVPYFIERSPSSEIRENGKSERCSILCVKSLQKNIQRRHAEDVADYCRFHPLSLSSSNRHSFSCPSSLAILPPTPSPSVGDDEGKEELQPLKRDTEDLTEATLQEL